MMRVLPLFVALAALAACSKSTPAAANTEAAAPVAAAPAQPPQAEAPKPVPAVIPAVVARINGEAIEKAEFEQAVKDLEGQAGGPVPADQRDRVYRDVLDRLIANHLLAQEARSRNVTVTDMEVTDRLDQIKKQFPSEQAFTDLLAQRGMTLAAIRDDIKQGMSIDKMLTAEIASKVAVTPAEVDDFYQKNPSQFQQPERVRASHILVSLGDNANAVDKEQARTRAADLLKQVKEGKDFAALARQYSEDQGSAPGGGDLGFFQRGQMVGPFDQAAFSLQPGQTSELVETNFGFHIIRVAEKQPARTLPLTEIRPQLQQFLENQRRDQQTEAFVAALKAKGKIEVLI
jgi:peptidyl-prolyl cis-trans isomerase C